MSDREALRERVARAMYEIPTFGASGAGWEPWADADNEVREHYRHEADAAIAICDEDSAGLRAENEQARMREACAADLAREWEHHCRTAEAEREALRAEVERLAEELSIWKSVFPDIAPEQVLPDRSKVEAEVERLRAALKTARPFVGWAGYYPAILAEIDAALEERI